MGTDGEETEGFLEQGLASSSLSNFQFEENSLKLVKYFHNDIKTENLVLSGETLEKSGNTNVQHATLIYQHMHPGALGKTLEDRVEGVSLWACGVVLVQLLAAELNSDFVHRHRGMGGDKINNVLSIEHCLADPFDCSGPRDLLDTIFSEKRTPTLTEVLAHPWVARARESCREPSVIAKMNEKLDKLRTAGTSAFIAWIPLADCIHVVGQPPPIAVAKQIIEHVQVASDF